MNRLIIKHLVNSILKDKLNQPTNGPTPQTRIIDDKYVFIETKQPLTTEAITCIQKGLLHSQFVASNTDNTVAVFKLTEPEYYVIQHIKMTIDLIQEESYLIEKKSSSITDIELTRVAGYLQNIGFKLKYYSKGEEYEPTIEVLIPKDTPTEKKDSMHKTLFKTIDEFASRYNISEEFLQNLHITLNLNDIQELQNDIFN